MARQKATPRTISPDLIAQRNYWHSAHERGLNFNLVVAEAFLRGIRDIGYKHTGTALFELVDNAIQAEATQVHVLTKFDGAPLPELAVIDDGHGMDPEMIRLSVMWGGTHREGDRSGFGRYGYGLPSASVSQGRRFTVYSKVADGVWHSVTIDVDDIGDGKYTNERGDVEVPRPQPASLPQWVQERITTAFGAEGLSSGSVVVIEKADQLSWKSPTHLERNLMENFGITYRNFVRQVPIYVNGKSVDAIDPLFLTPGDRYYDFDDDRAVALPPLLINVKEESGEMSAVKVRFSYMPPTFQRLDKNSERGKMNPRFPIMKAHNGIIVLRNGRQIDVVTHNCPWTTFINYDRNWGVEVDFPATLDREFAITTAKQQVRPTERMWTILKEAGVYAAIEQMRKMFKVQNAELAHATETEGKPRASEQVMKQAAKFKTKLPAETEKTREEGEAALQKEAKRRARTSGLPEPEVTNRLRKETQEEPYRVRTENLPGAPFYRVAQLGGQRVLYINIAHRFFTDLYGAPGATPRLRAALEVLLWVLGECELDASDDRRRFYETERAVWSNRFGLTLDILDTVRSIDEELANAEPDAGETPAAPIH